MLRASSGTWRGCQQRNLRVWTVETWHLEVFVAHKHRHGHRHIDMANVHNTRHWDIAPCVFGCLCIKVK